MYLIHNRHAHSNNICKYEWIKDLKTSTELFAKPFMTYCRPISLAWFHTRLLTFYKSVYTAFALTWILHSPLWAKGLSSFSPFTERPQFILFKERFQCIPSADHFYRSPSVITSLKTRLDQIPLINSLRVLHISFLSTEKL